MTSTTNKQYIVPTLLIAFAAHILLILAFFSAFPLRIALFMLIACLLTYILAFKPMMGILAMAFTFAFIEGHVYLTGFFTLPYVDAFALLTGIAFLIRRLWLAIFDEQPITKKECILIGPFLLFFFSYALSLYNTDFLFASVKYLFRPILFFYLMFILLPYNVMKSQDDLRDVLWMMFLAGMMTSMIGILSLLSIEHGSFPRIQPIGLFDLWPLGVNHNVLAQALVMIIPATCVLVYLSENEYIKKLLMTGVFVMIFVALGTFSRAAWIALGVQAIVFIWFFYRKEIKKWMKYAPYILIFFIPFFILMSQLLMSDISASANKNRLLLSDIAMTSFYQHPIIGNGAGMFQSLVAQDRWYINWFGNPMEAHGFVQKIMAEAGLIGLIAFSYFVYCVYRYIRHAYTQTDEIKKQYVILGLGIAVLSGFVFQLFNTSYFLSVLWFPVGILLSSTKLRF